MARVFIFSQFPLFGQGIENLLRHEAGIEIVGREADTEQALRRITELHPDIVLTDNSGPASDLTATMTRLMKIDPPVRVIGLDITENKLHLYRREERAVRDVQNLVDAIQCQVAAG